MTSSTENKTKLVAMFFTLFLFAAGILAILIYFYYLPGRLDPQGNANANCTKIELPVIANGAGIVVSAHHTICNDDATNSTYYVYLHKQAVAENSDYLIFRYADILNDPTAAPPKIEWNGNSALSISVGDIVHISKLISMKDGVKINYAIGKEADTLIEGSRPKWAVEEVAVLLFFILILLMTSSYKIIRLMLKYKRGGE